MWPKPKLLINTSNFKLILDLYQINLYLFVYKSLKNNVYSEYFEFFVKYFIYFPEIKGLQYSLYTSELDWKLTGISSESIRSNFFPGFFVVYVFLAPGELSFEIPSHFNWKNFDGHWKVMDIEMRERKKERKKER